MSKRKVTFEIPPVQEEEAEEAPGDDGQQEEVPFAKKFKHTLDSDEEDDEEKSEKYNVMDPEYLEGEEDGVSRVDNDVKITPFNLSEEMEEGHFDKEGAFVYDKKKDEINDHWLDNIDWVKIKQVPPSGESAGTSKERQDEETDQGSQEIDVFRCYESLLVLMRTGESVQRTIQRLGKNSRKVKQLKSKKEAVPDDLAIEQKDLLEVTSHADRLVLSGDMDVYQKTFEQMTHLLSERKKEEEAASMDMFADEVNINKDTAVEKQAPAGVRWEFKWENKDEAKVFGPHTNDQMVKWVNDGYFDTGVWVRDMDKAGGQFYNSKRMDFELYS